MQRTFSPIAAKVAASQSDDRCTGTRGDDEGDATQSNPSHTHGDDWSGGRL